MSEESEYDYGQDVLEEEDYCDYTGEQCCGDRMFCEECIVWKELEESVKTAKKELLKK